MKKLLLLLSTALCLTGCSKAFEDDSTRLYKHQITYITYVNTSDEPLTFTYGDETAIYRLKCTINESLSAWLPDHSKIVGIGDYSGGPALSVTYLNDTELRTIDVEIPAGEETVTKF